MQSVSITTKVVNSNPAHGEVYSIQHYVIKFVCDLRKDGGFLHHENWPQRYNCNIVEGSVKHYILAYIKVAIVMTIAILLTWR